jgi:hypothetical protein
MLSSQAKACGYIIPIQFFYHTLYGRNKITKAGLPIGLPFGSSAIQKYFRDPKLSAPFSQRVKLYRIDLLYAIFLEIKGYLSNL